MRIWILLTITLLLAGCALESVTEPHRVDPATEPTPVPTSVVIAKPTYNVERGTVTRNIKLSGQIVPIAEIDLAFELNGTVADILVERGDNVAAGDVLATLSNESYQADLLLAQSNFEIAQVRLTAVETQIANERRRAEIALESAELRLNYANSLVVGTATAEQTLEIGLRALDIEMAQLAVDELISDTDPALKAEVDQAQLRVDELTSLMQRTELVAPKDGTVLRLSIKAGQAAVAGQSAIIMADLTALEVRASVSDEEDMEKLLEGQVASLIRAARPGEAESAEVRLLPPPFGSGEGLDESEVRLQLLTGGESQFELGDRISIEMLLAENENVMWLPPAAIRDFKGRNFVVVQEADTQRRIDVTLGLVSADRIEILEGVEAGDTVIGP